MWHRLKNLFLSLDTYRALSPDLRVRQQVNRTLSDRPALSSDEWFHAFYQSRGVTYITVVFVYHSLEKYSGIEMSRVWPTDRIHEDLHWSLVCWFDWESQLCCDVHQQFGVDISECLEDLVKPTIGELVVIMDQVCRNALQKNPV